VRKEEDLEVWAKDMEDGSKVLGLFNRGETDTTMVARWPELGLSHTQIVRDLWRQADLGIADGQFRAAVPRHGVVLLRLRPDPALPAPKFVDGFP